MKKFNTFYLENETLREQVYWLFSNCLFCTNYGELPCIEKQGYNCDKLRFYGDLNGLLTRVESTYRKECEGCYGSYIYISTTYDYSKAFGLVKYSVLKDVNRNIVNGYTFNKFNTVSNEIDIIYKFTNGDVFEGSSLKIEDELHAKAERRVKKKEIMPIDGRGLVTNNVNRKFKQERKAKDDEHLL